MDNVKAFLSATPGWMIALIVVVAGWLVARVARVVVARLLRLLHFNQLCERIGVYDFLRKGEVALTPSQLAGRGIYWAILIGVFLEAARLLDIGVAVDLRQRAEAALPALLSAILVLVVGLLGVAFLAGFVRTVIRNSGSPFANLWWRMIKLAGAILVLAVAIEQAEIRGSVLAGALHIGLAAVALGMALAFGLGCKDMARDAMQKWIADIRERHRDSSKSDMEG